MPASGYWGTPGSPKRCPAKWSTPRLRPTWSGPGGADCVLTHCAPSGILPQIDLGYRPDTPTDFLETLRQRCRFSKCFCGHYHVNQVIDERFVIQWEQISRVE